MDITHKPTLQKSALFAGISAAEYENLIHCLSPSIKHFSKNEILLMTGDMVRHIGIILSGSAVAYLEHMDGSQILMSNLTPRSVFGEILVGTRTHKSPVTIYATADTTVAFVEYSQLFSSQATGCAAYPTFLQNILKTIGDKYFRMFDRINILREKTLRAKIMAYLQTMRGEDKTTCVTIPFSKTMLANFLMANRSALSKELRRMEDEDIIVVKGRTIKLQIDAHT